MTLFGGTVALSAIGYGIWNQISTGISRAAEDEAFQIQFENLLGSVDKAKQRMSELKKFAQFTPFETPEVVRASKTLEVITKGALSTQKGLELVGDAAYQANVPIDSLAMWVARLYDGLRANRPVGEAMMRIQELGLISGDVRNKIEDMQKQGAKFTDMWNLASGILGLGRFKGAMKQSEKAFESTMSALRDGIGMLRSNLFSGLLSYLTASGKTLTGSIGKMSEAVKKFKWESIGDKIAVGANTLSEIADEFTSGNYMFLGEIKTWFTSLPNQLGDVLGSFIGDLTKNVPKIFNRIGEFLLSIFNNIQKPIAMGIEKGLSDAFGPIIGIFAKSMSPNPLHKVDAVKEAIAYAKSKFSDDGESKKLESESKGWLERMSSGLTDPLDFSLTKEKVNGLIYSNPLMRRYESNLLTQQEGRRWDASYNPKAQEYARLREEYMDRVNFTKSTSNWKDTARLRDNIRSDSPNRAHYEKQLASLMEENRRIQERIDQQYKPQYDMLVKLWTELSTMNTALVGGR
jgi:hypothetical protein